MPVIKGVSRIAEITDSLYVCGVQSVDAQQLRLLGVTHVINLTVEAPNVVAHDVTCERIALDDTPHAQLGAHFDACADRIESVRRAGGKTLVHCMAGASRSVAICIAYLMKHHQMTLLAAYKRVKLKRPIARPNVGFFRQLIDFEKRLFGVNTVAMVQSPIGVIPDVYLEQTKGMLWPDCTSFDTQETSTRSSFGTGEGSTGTRAGVGEASTGTSAGVGEVSTGTSPDVQSSSTGAGMGEGSTSSSNVNG